MSDSPVLSVICTVTVVISRHRVMSLLLTVAINSSVVSMMLSVLIVTFLQMSDTWPAGTGIGVMGRGMKS